MWVHRLGGPSQGSSPAWRSRGRVLPATKFLNHMVMGRRVPADGYMVHAYDRGSGQGLALARTVPQLTTYINSNKLKLICMLRTICGRTGWAALPKALPLPGGRGVESCRLHKF